MRRVRNHTAIKRLAGKSFRASRTRNMIAVIAIMLTAILFTSVFTIGLGMVENMQRSMMQQSGGDAHGAVKDMTQEQYEQMKDHPLIKDQSKEVFVAYEVLNPEFLKRHLEMHYVTPRWYEHWLIDITEGRAPEAADEILMDEKSMEILGLEAKAGQQVTLELRVHATDQETVRRTFTVTGIIRPSEGMNVGFVFVSEAYLEEYKEELTKRRAQEWDTVGLISMEVIFDSSANIQQNLEKIVSDSGYSNDPSDKNYVASNGNWAYMSEAAQSDPMTTGGLIGALLLILITGYLIIYNIFQISVIRDIRYYGLLKTIGTTGRQIRRILRGQALCLCLLGIPAGLILGYFTGSLLLPLIVNAGAAYRQGLKLVSPRWWIFVGAAVFTVATVLISEWRPARIASGVSPVEALYYTGAIKLRRKQKRSTDGGRVWRMAFSNLGRSRGRTCLVICSLSLTAVLLNSVYTVTHSVSREGMISKMIVSEALIGNAGLWNYKYRPYDEAEAQEQGLSESFVEACRGQESFADGGRIYMSGPSGAALKKSSWTIPDTIEKNENGEPGQWYPDGFQPYSTNTEGDYWVDYYGVEAFVISKMEVVEGEKDTQKIWEKLQTGNYMIYAAPVHDTQNVIPEQMKHHAGDVLTLKLEDGTVKEYEIISVIKNHTFSLQNKMSNDFPYYVSAEEFLSHFSSDYLMSYLMDAKEGQEEALEEFLADYTTSVEPAMNYDSRTMYEGMVSEILKMILLVGTALAAVIGLIGLLNFTNTMLTSVVTRKREFAMMEAIGMTKRQLVAMLTAEGLYYVLLTILCSLLLSTLFSLSAIRMIGSGLWMFRYRFTLLPFLLIAPALLLLGVLVPRVIYALNTKETIVEQIRE